MCFAEKTHPELLPHISEHVSPMSALGRLLQQWQKNVYHVSVMPCADKKLEAARAEHVNDDDKRPYTDCALTTGACMRLRGEVIVFPCR